MDLKREKKPRIFVDDILVYKYPHDLQLYIDYPDVSLTLREFEDYAIERLKVLRIIENATLKGIKNPEEWRKLVVDELNKQGLKLYRKLITSSGIDNMEDKEKYEIRQRDCVSHFILRIAYCQSEEYRRWFNARELELFKLRWSFLSQEGKKSFLKFHNLNFSPLDVETFRQVNEESGGFLKPASDYYCVQWTDVLDLIRHRKVFLDRGRTYISSADLVFVLGARFRSHLSHSLVTMSHKLSKVQEDGRLKRMIKNLHHAYVGKTYIANENGRNININNIDALSRASFPLCMKQMYSAVKTQHHLKHWGRQQLGLFLKGIGLSLEDALLFWRSEFTKKPEIDLDAFEKKYAYGIRYNYGKEGKRTNYTPYSCGKIISSAPGPGEFHGCPFKYNDVQNLRQTLTAVHLSDSEINEVLSFVNQRQYQLACSKYFEALHKLPLISSVNHPNQYFEESQKIIGTKKEAIPNKFSVKSIRNFESTSKRTNQEAIFDEKEFEVMDWSQLPDA